MRSQDSGDLPEGTRFYLSRAGRHGQTEGMLGAGGQGAVYDVTIDGVPYALKWYHPSYVAVDGRLRARLLRAIEQGAPDPAFLWPLDLAEISGSASFGYVMRLRPPDYRGMRDLIARPPQRAELPLQQRAVLCLRITQCFLELHASGFCYQDINFGNIFFHPDTGDILICDNDNVDIDGSPAAVYGTRKFMAPEIVRREAMPGTQTDLFSMAVLFFYVLHAWHPLDGAREAAVALMDAKAEMLLYGSAPLFLFDPADTSNGPVAGMHEPVVARWNALPPALRELFIRSFTRGLRQPDARVLEAEWRTAFAALVGATFACPSCGFEHAAHPATPQGEHAPRHCVACGGALPVPALLAVGRGLVSLTPGKRLPGYLLRPGQSINPLDVAAVVEAHPSRLGLWGLRNLGRTPWTATLSQGGEVTVPPDRAVRILAGTRIDFGGGRGTMLAWEAAGAIPAGLAAAGSA